MRKKIVMLLLAVTLSTTMPIMVSATELPADAQALAEEELQSDVDINVDANETVSEETFVENEMESDVINSINTKYSDDTSGMICITAIVPDNFGLSATAEIKNVDTGVVYALTMYADNDYMDRCYVPEGNYCILSAGVYGDNTSKYSFDFPDSDFYIEQKQTADFEVIMTNFDDVTAEIQTKRGEIPEDTEHVKSDFDVNFVGTGTGELGITGEQNAEYDLQFKITKAGGLNEAMFAYSKDGGNTWSEDEVVPLSGYKKLGSSGLTVEFFLPARDGAAFAVDDLFNVYIPDPDTRINIKKDGTSDAELAVVSNTDGLRAFNALEKTGFSIRYEILRGGTFGTAVGRYSTDNGASWSDEEYINKDTVLTAEDGTSIILRFTASDKDMANGKAIFSRGTVYSVTAVRENEPVDTTGLFIVLGIIFGGGGFAGYKWLKSQIPEDKEYRLKV